MAREFDEPAGERSQTSRLPASNAILLARATKRQCDCRHRLLAGSLRFHDRPLCSRRVNAPTADHGREVRALPGKDRTVLTPQGELLEVPSGWELLPPGDAALSRRIKADGPHWIVRERKGRKVFSRGIWAPADRIAALRSILVAERQDPAYARRLQASRERRAKTEEAYGEAFEEAVRRFLAFAPAHQSIGNAMARRIVAHAVPVGSGTVARTRRIPLEERAEAATIAWMRHQTTAYDSMRIPRERGARREVRRLLADRSRALLERYRRGDSIDPGTCPLSKALLSRRKPSA